MPIRKFLPLLLIALITLTACTAPIDNDGPYERATIISHVDGDTVVIRLRGTDQRLRMIGVDTPETRHPNKPVEAYGQEASAYTAKALPIGATVWLQKDTSETDKYGRLLRYVWKSVPTSSAPTDEEIRHHMYNADLLIQGYAKPVSYPPDVQYAAAFKTFAQEARAKKRGLWANTPDDTTRSIPTEAASLVANGQGQLKGNRKSKIYHSPGQQAYDKIAEHNIVYFNNPTEAEAAGYRAAKQ